MRKQTEKQPESLEKVLDEAQKEADAIAAARMPPVEPDDIEGEPDEVVQKARAFYQRRTLANAKRLDHLAQNAVSEPVKLGAINAMNDRATGKPTQEIINRTPASDAVLERVLDAFRAVSLKMGDKEALDMIDVTPEKETQSNLGEKGDPTLGDC